MRVRGYLGLLARSCIIGTVFLAAPIAESGDEVDYSAPYLVVEDGELVTKYPNREHEAGAEEAADDEAETSAPGAADEANRGGLVAAALAVVVAGLLLIVRRKRRRSPRRASTAE